MIPNQNKSGNTQSSDLGDAISFASTTFEPRVFDVEHDGLKAQIILMPNGQGGMSTMSVKRTLDEYRTEPERRKGTIVVDDVDSFIALVNRDKRDESVIFASLGESPSMTAVLDYHPGSAEAGWCEDRISYAFPVSDEWTTWTEANGKEEAKSQAEFAQYLEDHIFDIGEPGAAGAIAQAFATKLGVSFAGPQRLMETSRGLSIRVEETVRNVVNLGTGEVQFVFGTENKDTNGAPLSVPAAFHIMIPIFKGGPTYSIPVRLRYRAGGGKIMWWFEMHRADLFFADASKETISRVRLADAIQADAPPSPEGESTALATTPAEPIPFGCGLPVLLGPAPAVCK
jgi:uncharacterized protein YfdQ (DUF2303 family)